MHQSLWAPVRAVLLASAVSCLNLAGTAAAASGAAEDPPWIPEGIRPGGILNPADSTKFTGFGCNAVSFASDPSLGNYCIGRLKSRGCRGPWSLVLARINWAYQRFEYVQHVFDTRNGPVAISGGKRVSNAYDPQVMAWDNETWVAFECTGEGINRAATCMGPLKKDLTLDTSRTNLVIQGADDRYYHYGASVPKLLAYKHRAYIYWTRIKSTLPPRRPVKIDTWGVEIKKGSDGKFWAVGSAGRSMASNDPAAVEVFGTDPSDPQSDSLADLFQTITDGQTIYITGGRGGSGCFAPGGLSAGCYRLTIGKTTDPLGYHGFNQNLIPDSYLPRDADQYYRFVYRPSDNKTVLLGGIFLNPQHIPGAPVGIWAYVWPANLF